MASDVLRFVDQSPPTRTERGWIAHEVAQRTRQRSVREPGIVR